MHLDELAGFGTSQPNAPSGFRLRPSSRAATARARRPGIEHAPAFDTGSLTLLFQPRTCLRTGRRTGGEAVPRWTPRKRRALSPGAFTSVTQRHDPEVQIAGGVLRAACLQAAGWPGGLRVSISVSPRQFKAGVLITQVARALDESGLSPERLELGLTESLLLDASLDTLLALSAMRDLGVDLAISNFGKAFASLRVLRLLPLTVMKIDQSLVRVLPGNREDIALLSAIIATGQALRMRIVAAGIACERQRDVLAASGCDEGQGHLFGQPLPPADFLARMGARMGGETR